MHHLIQGVLPCLLLLGVIASLLIKEPHMSATVIILVIAASMMFVAGLKWRYIIPVGALGIVACVILAMTSEYRWKRVIIFLDPWQDKRRRWLANYTITLCDRLWRIVWRWPWKKYTKIYVHTRASQ